MDPKMPDVIVDKNGRKIIPLPGGRSEVWKRKLFGFYTLDGKTILDRQRAVCCVCFYEIPYSGNTTNLGIHLAKRHSELYFAMKNEMDASGKPRARLPGPRNKSNTSATEHHHHHQQQQSTAQTASRTLQVVETVATFLAQDLHSSNVAEGDGFKYLLGVLEPRVQTLDFSQLLESLQNKRQSISNALLQQLSETEACALTADCWSADNGRNYCTLLVRLIDTNWEVHNYALKTLEITAEQTHANHIWDINKVLADWTLMPRIVYHQSMETSAEDSAEMPTIENPIITVEVSQMKVIAGVTNDTGNVALALKHLGMTSVPCFANAVNGAVGAGINGVKAPSVNELISRARRLVAHFTRSVKDRYALSKKAEEMQAFTDGNYVDTINELVVDIFNRWTTTAEMIRRLLELKGPLNSILMVHKERAVRELGLTAEEWYQLEELHSAMKAVSMAIGILGGDEHASCSMVAPLLHRLKEKFMKIMEHDTPAVFQYKKVVWDHLNPHYNDSDTQTVFNISSFLDPRFKDLVHLTETQKDEVIQAVRQMVIEVEENSQNVLLTSAKSNDLPPTKRPRRRLQELDLLFGTMDEKNLSASISVNSNDVDKYLQEAATDIKDSPLEWWKRNHHRYPSLAKLARRHLCIPATSVPSECILSHEGSVFYNRRKRLLADEVDNMIFLHSNLPLDA